jgi:hypothetical protein
MKSYLFEFEKLRVSHVARSEDEFSLSIKNHTRRDGEVKHLICDNEARIHSNMNLGAELEQLLNTIQVHGNTV